MCSSLPSLTPSSRSNDVLPTRDNDLCSSLSDALLSTTTPSSLIVREVGELSEIFQWKGEVPKRLPDWDEKEKEHVGEELSDVLLYLVRLPDICSVDLGKTVLRKM
ncbi:uncharacterized protein A4U43_C10F9010 [Asparagus officinalis]|uniref:dCTP pyrophosphatase 1 n=1 Tax=Asparagus officinalis TaxID=4686 RepID=A0A5P1E637_ASPOF|nr:uncharacterized protein A4U43_C10F9010 [Asparagus officinalis]